MGTTRGSKAGGAGEPITGASAGGNPRATNSAADSHGAKPSATPAAHSKGVGALERLCSRDDGWLRLAPDGDLNQVYLKFKFVGGSLGGNYVMVMCHWSEAAWGLELLEEKIASVYAGTLRPVVDKWYQVD